MADQNVKVQGCTGCPEECKSVLPILLIVLGVLMLMRNLIGKEAKKREA